jgi:rare lipoprotein A
MTDFNLKNISITKWAVIGIMLLMITQLTGCGRTRGSMYGSGKDGAPSFHVDASKVPDAVPKYEKPSRYGNPKSYVVRGKRHYVMKDAANYREKGGASWYGTKFHSRRTSSGEPYDLLGMTAAHKTLPIPSYVRVTNLKNGREVIVKVNDRGPFHGNRIIDLSYVAAKKLGISGTGTGMVEVAVVTPSDRPSNNPPIQLASAAQTEMKIPSETGHKPKLYLQMGVFAEKTNAERIARSIESHLKTPVQVKPDRHNSQLVYRVRVPVQNEDKVNVLSEQLAEKGLGRPVRVVE